MRAFGGRKETQIKAGRFVSGKDVNGGRLGRARLVWSSRVGREDSVLTATPCEYTACNDFLARSETIKHQKQAIKGPYDGDTV